MTGRDHTEGHVAPRRASWLALACLIAVLLLALAFRLYQLREQSVWYDERISIVHLDQPGLSCYLRALRPANWNMVPLYFTLQYGCGKLISSAPYALRLLSIFFGLLCIPLVYALGCDLFGRAAGLVAALACALSAVHVFQAQEIRYYALTSLLALCSAYTLIRALRRGGAPWWALHFLANVLLMWTFLFGAFLIVAEACFVALSRWRCPRTLALWFGATFVSMIPSMLWIARITNSAAPMGPVPAWVLMNSFLADFRYGFMYFVPPGIEWQFIPGRAARLLEDTHAWADNALLALLCLCAAGLLVSACRAFFRKDAVPIPDTRHPIPDTRHPLPGTLFLACWLLVPGLMLLILARFWRPDVFATRYTAYSSFAAYLIIGGAVQRLRRPLGRAALIAALVALMGHHLLAFYTHPQRTDWCSATHYIKAHLSGNDAYLVYPWVQGQVLAYNMRPIEAVVPQSPSVDAVCAQTEQHLAEGKTVWVTFAAFFHGEDMDSARLFERYLRHRNMAFVRKAYWSGMQCLFVFRIEQPGFVPLDDEGLRTAFDTVARGYRQAPEYVRRGGDLQARGDLEGAEAAYREALALDPLCVPAYEALGTLLVNEKRDFEAAITLYRTAIALIPDDAALHAQLAIALDQHGESDAAYRAARTAITLEPYGRPWIRTSFRYLHARLQTRRIP